MANPFEVLGLKPGADADEVRHAYRMLAKQCHPDQFQEEGRRQEAQEQMIRLNLAYEEALKLALPVRASAARTIPRDDAIHLARKMLTRSQAEAALRELMRSEDRNAEWYALKGQVFMALEQYDAAHSAFREAIRMEPDNNDYRSGALDAVIAMRKEKTLEGRVRKFWRNTFRTDDRRNNRK